MRMTNSGCRVYTALCCNTRRGTEGTHGNCLDPEQQGHTQIPPSPSSVYVTHPVRHPYHSSMSSITSTPCNFTALFDCALTDYTKRTGIDLHSHPLASILERCDSPDSILAILQEQSRAFGEFRNGDPKLIKSLGSLVNLSHAISTSAVTSAGASLVGPSPFHILLPT